ncbi:MAG: UDP-N-acetylmuramoyl-L-alanine--D-glutamate ligase [Pleurocapsa minor GSE-CHR-MK-17-07R]|jgi:UDP-N-acetylmuramoylalanine--D-glutamate ligase|nr:UDP-N-acetylmuramoyl-L-alanine--D-glutamate ligase [Pleurocapsa minor GSE-CHR-MK 17-07R]
MDFTDPLRGKRVLVLGFARQGQALARWLPTVGAQAIVSDSKTAEQLSLDAALYPGVEFALGAQEPGLLDGIDTVCVSGGVPLDLPIVREAISRGIPLANDAQFFLERCPCPVLGITGSAGKTTTTTLTGEILKAAGYKTWVGGNIGDVLLDNLADIHPADRVVMELSSFQLELMTISPDYACITNITPNHLDRHGTMEAYAAAKANIYSHHHEPANVTVLGKDDPGARAQAEHVYGRLAWFSMDEMVQDGAFLAGSRLVLTGISSVDAKPQAFADRSDIRVRGDHNVLNVLAACALTGAAGVKAAVMREAIRGFQGVPHRLEIVRELDGITYINDSIATAPERVLAALKSFNEPLILLLGGKDKKLPWEDMLRLALSKSRHIVVFGDAAPMILSVASTLGADMSRLTHASNLDEAVGYARAFAQPGDTVLLSPGGTSYDAYVDFAARGEHFRSIVRGLRGRKKSYTVRRR